MPPLQITSSWFKAIRSAEAMELIRANVYAFILAYFIALRARWREGFNEHGLEVGEAFIGDFENYGMTERQYRTAKHQLQKWKFATFRATNKGTIAKLIDTRLFSTSSEAGDEQNDSQPTDKRRTADGQETTNVEGIEGIERKDPVVAASVPDGISLAGEQIELLEADDQPTNLVTEEDIQLHCQDTSLTGINVREEYNAMLRWCKGHRRQPTKRRFINWLNKAAEQLRYRSESRHQSRPAGQAPLPTFTETRQLRPDEL